MTNCYFLQKQAMLVRQLEDEVVKAKTQASHTNPEVLMSHQGVNNQLIKLNLR